MVEFQLWVVITELKVDIVVVLVISYCYDATLNKSDK